MRVLLVTKRTRAGSEETSERQTVLDAPEIRLGRGAPMEINLPEIDIDYHHATLTAEEGHLILSAVGENGITAKGKRVHDVVLSPGAEAEIGRYRFSAGAAREGADLVLTMDVLPVQVRAKRPEKRTLAQVLPSRRALSWVLTVVLMGVFLGWPLSEVLTRPVPAPDAVVLSDRVEGEVRRPHLLEAAFSSGPLSKAHAEIGGECSACHYRAFERASTQACLSCHATVQNHAAPADHPMANLDGGECADCHKEHMGGERPVQTASTGCTNCHANLVAVAPTTRLKPISTFLGDHPNFEPAIITEVTTNADGVLTPVLVPRPFPPDTVLQERSGLKFPHNKHMAEDGVALISGRQPLECADCHVTEADGNLMRPIKMERDCGGCHVMEFAPAGTAIALPHADEAGVAEIVKGYFLARVAEGSVTLTPEPSNTFRRRIGGQNHRVQEELTEEWALGQTERELDAIFGIRLCATCHEAEKVEGFATASG
ncbi:MAG: cytochrome c3 family protein, partial [Pseudomonadota bacterium]